MGNDARLKELWAFDEPPVHDPAFVLATLARIAQRRFWADTVTLATLVIATAVIFWAVAPAVEIFVQSGLAETDRYILSALGLVLTAVLVTDKWQPERF